MWPTPRWPRSPARSAWPRGRSRPSSTAAASPWPPGSGPGRRAAMLEQRLRSAAGSLERSVAGLDATERLGELAVRRRRRTTGAVLAVVLAAAVLGGVALAVQHARGPERVAGPVTAAPARVVATVPVPGTPVAVAIGHGAVWTVAADANQVVRVDPASGRITARVPVPHGPAQLAVTGDAVWVLCPPDNSISR